VFQRLMGGIARKMMRKYIALTLILTVLCSLLLFGCGYDGSFDYADDVAVEFDEVEEAEEWEEWEVEDEADIWEDEALGEIAEEAIPIEGDGIHGLISRVEHGDNVVYIFGSMHYGRSHWYPLHPAVEEAMRRSDAFVFETDITPEAQGAIASEMLGYMMLDDTTLSEFLEEDVFIQMMEAVETYGVSYSSIRQFTPWVVGVFLAEIAYHRVGITSTYGIDFYVMGFARTHGLPILYLNPLEHEMNLAFNLTDEMQHYAALSIESLDVAIGYVEMLVHAYETQDIEQITAMVREDLISGEVPNPLEEYLINVVIIQRSIEFAREMIRLLEQTEEPTTFFVTMGIGHMVGDDYGNVFNYLLDAGFEVVPMYR